MDAAINGIQNAISDQKYCPACSLDGLVAHGSWKVAID
jgi:hypothetical protein